MEKNYLKIGEFAKLRGVSIKALRYYDRIGVLKPAYISEETGYRYYLPEQLILLDVIQLCLTFQLPLKNLENSAQNLSTVIGKWNEQAEKKLVYAQNMLRLSQDILEQAKRLNQVHGEGEIYKEFFKKRCFLLSKWDEKKDGPKGYLSKISKLYEKAQKLEVNVLTQQGIMFDLERQEKYVFLNIEGECRNTELYFFPEGEYQCMILKEKEFKNIPQILGRKLIKVRYIFCLNTDIYDYCLEHSLHHCEIQWIS